MAKKRYSPEENVIKLRQVEVLHRQGMAATDAIRQIGVSEVTYLSLAKGIPRHGHLSVEAA